MLDSPQNNQKLVLGAFWAPAWTPKSQKNSKKGGSGTPLVETSKKTPVFIDFWSGPPLENGAPVQAGARFSRNHRVRKKLPKGTLLTSFFEAFRYQKRQKVDLGATLKLTEKMVSPFWAKVRKLPLNGAEYLVLFLFFFRPLSHLGPKWAPRAPPDPPGGGFEEVLASFFLVFNTFSAKKKS